MSKTKIDLTNWTSGELSPYMFGRVDTSRYFNGAAGLTNFIVRQQGPISVRPGTRFIAETKTSSKLSILREFEFSDLQSYILEIGEHYIRVYYDGGFVETSPGSGVPLEIVTPYLQADLAALKFTQSADVLFVVHPSYPPQVIQRLGANNWTISQFLTVDGPYMATAGVGNCNLGYLASYCRFTINSAVFSVTANQKNITAISVGPGGSTQITVTAHGYSTNQQVFISQVTGTTEANGQWIITVIDANNFWLRSTGGIGSMTSNRSYLGGGKVSSTLASLLVEYRDENLDWRLGAMQQASSTTVGYGYPTQFPKTYNIEVKIIATSGTLTADHSGVFTIGDVGKYIRISNGTWYTITAYTDDSTVTGTAVSGLILFGSNSYTVTVDLKLLTYAVIAPTAPFVTFDTQNDGRAIRFNFAGAICYGNIIGFQLANVILVSVNQPVPRDPTNFAVLLNSGVTNDWRIGAFSFATGYARTIAFHQQRLCFGGTTAEPDTLWLGHPGDFPNFGPTIADGTITDDCSITAVLVSSKANPIIWLETGPVLLIGTQGGEWKANSASAIDGPLTPTSFVIKPQTSNGSLANSRVFRVGYALLFIQRAGRKAIELTYNFQLDSYVGKNLTVVSEHIMRKGGHAVTTAYQQEPDSILWVALSDGTFCGLTYELDQQVVAWHSHQLGGNGKVESLSCISSTAGTENLLYLLVNRTVNGVTKRYIEQLMPDYYPASPTAKNGLWLIDCGSLYSGAPATHISGLGYLEGAAVMVIGDGVAMPGLTVSGGAITLPRAASNVIVGLAYRSIMQIMPLDAPAQGGTVQGKVKRADRLAMRVFNTIGFKYGSDLAALDEATFIDDTVLVNTSPNFFTGDKLVSMPISYNLLNQFYIVQDSPYPLTIVSLMPDVSILS